MRYDLGRVDVSKRTRLPHWNAQHAIYAITFNLFDAIPAVMRSSLREAAQAQLDHIRWLRGSVTTAEQIAVQAWLNAKLGETLDHNHGSCFMRDWRVAGVVADAVQHFDEERYTLLSWCVMPNHVHVVASLCEPLDDVVHTWKSFTAKRCNMLLKRSDEFWRAGYYDRCMRDSAELTRTLEYVLNNPAAAGLTDWPFARAYPERLSAFF